jgi:hypothetical protein
MNQRALISKRLAMRKALKVRERQGSDVLGGGISEVKEAVR